MRTLRWQGPGKGSSAGSKAALLGTSASVTRCQKCGGYVSCKEVNKAANKRGDGDIRPLAPIMSGDGCAAYSCTTDNEWRRASRTSKKFKEKQERYDDRQRQTHERLEAGDWDFVVWPPPRKAPKRRRSAE